jgi:rod shape-determining protein MreC
MENFFVRYKNPLVLVAVLFIQVIGLATQVKRQDNTRGGSGGGTRLIRVWTVTAFTPVEKMLVSTGRFFRNGWHNYVDLRDVRKQNKALQDEVARLQMEQVRLRQDADQARRLQSLLEFKERYISHTVPAQIIGSSGTEQSRVVIIDKGSHDGLKPDMAVITPDGIVGKVKEVFPLSSQVLLINDHDSGAGVILERSRLQGILKGTSTGELQITDIMADERIEAGDHVITSGGDRIYPKGFSVGTVINAVSDRDNDPFLVIKIKPAADLRRLEEVLVVTKFAEESPAPAGGAAPLRAADILSQRLPGIPKQSTNAPKNPDGSPVTVKPTPTPAAKPSPTTVGKPPLPVAGATPMTPGTVASPTAPPKQPLAGAGANPAVSVPAKKTIAPETKTPGTASAAPAVKPGVPENKAVTSGDGAPAKKTVAPEKKAPAAGETNPATKTGATETKTGGAETKTGGAETKTGAAEKKTGVAGTKTGAAEKKPPSTGNSGGVAPNGGGQSPAGAAATATPTPKPKAAPKKANPAAPGSTPPSASATPAATPTPTPETPPR